MFNKKVAKSIALSVVAVSSIALCQSSASAHECRKGSSFSDIVVNAKPEVVFKAIVALRDQNKDTVKEVGHEGQHATILEEEFDNLPIIGQAKCTYKEMYEPYKTIEYTMVKSEKFKAFEGRWQLTPTEDGQGTNLSLSSFVDIDLPVPFAKQLCKMQTMRGVKRRLATVKKNCESKSIAHHEEASHQ